MLAFILKAALIVVMGHEMAVGLSFNKAGNSFKRYVVIVSQKASLGTHFSEKCASLHAGVVNEKVWSLIS